MVPRPLELPQAHRQIDGGAAEFVPRRRPRQRLFVHGEGAVPVGGRRRLAVERPPISLQNIHVGRGERQTALEVVGGAAQVAGPLRPVGLGQQVGGLRPDLAGVDDDHHQAAGSDGRRQNQDKTEVDLLLHGGPMSRGVVRGGGTRRPMMGRRGGRPNGVRSEE